MSFYIEMGHPFEIDDNFAHKQDKYNKLNIIEYHKFNTYFVFYLWILMNELFDFTFILHAACKLMKPWQKYDFENAFPKTDCI